MKLKLKFQLKLWITINIIKMKILNNKNESA